MKVYCVCVEEFVDEGVQFRVEIFSTIEQANLYLEDVTDRRDVEADIIEYQVDVPESGNTCYLVEDSDYSTSDCESSE